jgi:hypothetical protein
MRLFVLLLLLACTLPLLPTHLAHDARSLCYVLVVGAAVTAAAIAVMAGVSVLRDWLPWFPQGGFVLGAAYTALVWTGYQQGLGSTDLFVWEGTIPALVLLCPPTVVIWSDFFPALSFPQLLVATALLGASFFTAAGLRFEAVASNA